MQQEWQIVGVLHAPAAVRRPLVNVRLKSLKGSCGNIQSNTLVADQTEAVCAMPRCCESGCSLRFDEIHERRALTQMGLEVSWQISKVVCTCESGLVQLGQELLLSRALRHVPHNHRSRWTVAHGIQIEWGRCVCGRQVFPWRVALGRSAGFGRGRLRQRRRRSASCPVHCLWLWQRDPDQKLTLPTSHAARLDAWEITDVAVWVHAERLLVVRRAQGVVC
mmetsp:Transcript_49547/g.141584  ORF Transcript_49547/g.141584 Transcript_49547/m.141584 type:complete len:221 (-) Transcript_49547:530-1192(-)